MTGLRTTFGLGLRLPRADGIAGEAPEEDETVLFRETNGTVTVLSLAPTYTPILTRQVDGTVNVGA